MLSLYTQTVISILHDISCREVIVPSPEYALSPNQLSDLLLHLIEVGLVCPISDYPGYELARPASSISLLDILNTIGEKLEYSPTLPEDMYSQYHAVATRLGVIHSITQTCLSEIKLTDF